MINIVYRNEVLHEGKGCFFHWCARERILMLAKRFGHVLLKILVCWTPTIYVNGGDVQFSTRKHLTRRSSERGGMGQGSLGET